MPTPAWLTLARSILAWAETGRDGQCLREVRHSLDGGRSHTDGQRSRILPIGQAWAEFLTDVYLLLIG